MNLIIKIIRYGIGIAAFFVLLATLYTLKDYTLVINTESINTFFELFKTFGYVLTGFVAVYTLEISEELLRHRRDDLLIKNEEIRIKNEELKMKNEELKNQLFIDNHNIFKEYVLFLNKMIFDDKIKRYNSNIFQNTNIFNDLEYMQKYFYDTIKQFFSDNISKEDLSIYRMNYVIVEFFEKFTYKDGGSYYLKSAERNYNNVQYESKYEVEPKGLDMLKAVIMFSKNFLNIDVPLDKYDLILRCLETQYKKLFYSHLREYSIHNETQGYKYKLEK